VKPAAMFARHCWVRLRMVTMDPLAMIVLMFAGFSTVPLWTLGLGISGRGFNPVRPLVILWVPLVAISFSCGSLFRPSSAGDMLPALPIGRRPRIVAETVVAIVIVLLFRALGYGLGLDPAVQWGGQLNYHALRAALNTLLGVLVVLPLLLSWTAVPRAEARFLAKPFLLSAVLYAALAAHLMATPWSAAAVSLGLSWLVLTLEGTEAPPLRLPQWRPALLRASDGPVAQLRWDRLLGALREFWPLLAVVLPLPWAARTIAMHWDGDVLLARATFGLFVLLQFLALFVVVLHPFGISVSSAGPAAAARGYFVRAWSALPVSRRQVVRTVYFHALITTGLLWLLLYAHARRLDVALFELPFITLVAAIVLCEAVGDRARGLVAIGALTAYFAVPIFALWVSPEMRSLRLPWWAFLAAYLLAVVGGLPPLTHLRQEPRPA
jgi:hypothetical protein